MAVEPVIGIKGGHGSPAVAKVDVDLVVPGPVHGRLRRAGTDLHIRVPRWLARSGLIERGDAREMLAWENSGLSLDAVVCVAANDRAGLERLLRPFVRLLQVRFVEHCCRLKPKRRCPFLADTVPSGPQDRAGATDR